MRAGVESRWQRWGGGTMGKERRVLDRKVLFPGDVLIREGEFGDCAFFIQSGQMGVYKQSGGEEVLITVLPGNSIVGEMALIDNSPRSATVRCLETATVIQVTRGIFEKKMHRLDPFLVALLEMLVQKIRRLNADFTQTETRLQSLRRQVGLPQSPRGSGGGGPVSAAPLAVATAGAGPGPTQTAPSSGLSSGPSSVSSPPRPALPGFPTDVDPASLSRYDRTKLELALLYHPECTRERFTESVTRADVFREVWGALLKVEREIPANQETPVSRMENSRQPR